ncbi:MAG: flagellar M-ring protein FliF [Conexibacter sp.]|jgi:flagellar M-ring protein FliF|nr:flagellar M-ring protein FliF [Conexibacter sp.]
MPFRTVLANLSNRGRIAIAGAVLVIVVVGFLLLRLASAPSYTTLLTGIDPAQTGKATAALDTRGIPYELQNNGTALAVEKGQTAQARIALATAGITGSSQQRGFELLDRQGLGTSNFQQQVTYQRALEGELARTIQQVQGISGAQVNLVLPDKEAQLFSSNTNPATAAVLLSGAAPLDPSQVRGIAQLVANSVQGLKLDKVTITDGTGQLLWPTSSPGSAGGTDGALLAKQAAESQYDVQTASNLNAMLVRTLGPNKAQVQVNADLNANQATQDQLRYGRRIVPLTQRTDNETLRGTGIAPGGAAGTGTNNPPTYAQTGTGNSNYRHSTRDQTNGVDKTVTHTTIAPGQINSQSVSVLVDSSVPAASIPQLRAAVANAVGINARRGDRLSIGQVAFARPPVAVTASPVSKIGNYAKYVLLGLAALAFLIFVTRQLRKRERESLAGEPTWLREIEAPRTLAELERIEEPVPTAVLPLRSPEHPARMQVEELVERDPDRVAQQVRAWMQED